mmetsp:Transcript_26681/g.58481  ORF Transcript_26681/g.58481 Transcript_26681/m.58481 type:complete len:157 (+) Transcript_26681:307-777(+)
MMSLSTNRITLILAAIVLACLSFEIEGFAPSSSSSRVREQRISASFHTRNQQQQQQKSLVIARESSEESSGDKDSGDETEKISLEDKMKSWEASEEELRAASLGGVIPQPLKERTEAFDIGLYIAFPIMVLTGLAFAFFPFIMGNIDVSNIVVPTE